MSECWCKTSAVISSNHRCEPSPLEMAQIKQENEKLRAEIEELKEDVKGRIELIGLNSRYTTSVEFKNKALRELVREAIEIFDNDDYVKEDEWLEKAKEVLK